LDWAHFTLIVRQLTRYDEAIIKEFSLVGDRMTWLVLSESFIFAAFSVAAAELFKKSDGNPLLIAILICMSVLGFFLAGIVVPAIAAAHHAIERLKHDRSKLETQLPEHLQVRHIEVSDREHHRGNLPPMFVPPLIMVIWMALGISLTVALVQCLR
jgi:hypothetical protein